jgi:hypothetical protein
MRPMESILESIWKFITCTSKCRLLFNRKKNPRKSHSNMLTVDPSFEIKKHRNEPIKYNLELWQKTIGSMKKITTPYLPFVDMDFFKLFSSSTTTSDSVLGSDLSIGFSNVEFISISSSFEDVSVLSSKKLNIVSLSTLKNVFYLLLSTVYFLEDRCEVASDTATKNCR